MSTENDVPLGDGARQYYEQQFGARIRQVKKGGGQPSGGSSGSKWSKGGCGTIVLVFIGIRVIAALFRSSGTSSSSYHYNQPSLPSIQFQQPLEVPLPNQADLLLGADEANTALFGNADDVPLLRGLCYRIYQESLRPQPTLGGHLLKFLDPGMRDWLIEVAKGKELDQLEKQLFLTSLDLLLTQDDIWEANSLRDVPIIQDLIRDHKISRPPLHTLRERRQVLEMCYPRQIVPLSERDHLDDAARARWKKTVQADLEAARKQYEPAKH